MTGRTRPDRSMLTLFPFLVVVLTVTPAVAEDPPFPSGAETPAAQAPPEATAGPAVPPSTPIDQMGLRLSPLTEADLAAEAETWLALARAETEKVVEARIKLSQASEAESAALGEAVLAARAKRREVFDRFALVLAAWEGKGGDPAKIAGYRQYMNAVAREGIKSTQISTLWSMARKWLISRDGGIRWAIRLVLLVIAVLLLAAAAKIVSAVTGRAVGRMQDISRLLKDFLVRAAYWLTLVIGLAVVASLLGVNMSPVLAMIGGASFIIAFAMQSTLSNFAAGLLLMIYKPFDVGNVVTLAGTTGTVREVSLVSTTLVTGDNQVIVIPNGSVWSSVITNITANEQRRVDLVFGIGYDDDANLARKILEETVAAHPLVLEEPAPVIRLNELGDSSVNFICRPWTKSADYWAVYWDLTQQVKERFDAAGISIPFPQRDVHVYTHGAPTATS